MRLPQPPVSPGELPHFVRVVRDAVERVDGAGVRTAETVGQYWARIEFLAGNEAWKAQQINASANCKVTMRYRRNLRAADRIEWHGWRIEVVGEPIPDEVTRQSLVLMCEAKRV